MPIQIRTDPLASRTSSLTLKDNRAIPLRLGANGDTIWISCVEGETFGCLASTVARGLKCLENLGETCVEIEGFITSFALNKASVAWKRAGKSEITTVDFNIYGHRHSGKEVGDALTSMKLFLQEPDTDPRSLTYDNPQYLKLPGVSHVSETTHGPFNNVQLVSSSIGASQAEIEAILDHIPQPTFLREVSTDGRIRTPLIRFVYLN